MYSFLGVHRVTTASASAVAENNTKCVYVYTYMAEQLKLSLSDGVHHCPLPLHLSFDFIVGDVIVDFGN